MKIWLDSIIFPLLLIILLSIFTFWVNQMTNFKETINLNQSELITTMHDSTIKNYNIKGELENEIQANKIFHMTDSNFFTLVDSNIRHYKNGKMIQQIRSKEAKYNADNKEINIMGGYNNQKDNQLEIIINDF